MQQAFSLMEAQRPGWFRETVSLADAGGGIVWCCPDLFFAGVPDPDAPRTLIILFTHGRREAVRTQACLVAEGFYRARWQRCIRGREDWREISIQRFLSFNRFNIKDNE
ncbi:MAG: hypothetical protein LUE18_08390 [Akkermansia sp.]|nr:hypothetical protein [Akkermansia sp.]